MNTQLKTAAVVLLLLQHIVLHAEEYWIRIPAGQIPDAIECRQISTAQLSTITVDSAMVQMLRPNTFVRPFAVDAPVTNAILEIFRGIECISDRPYVGNYGGGKAGVLSTSLSFENDTNRTVDLFIYYDDIVAICISSREKSQDIRILGFRSKGSTDFAFKMLTRNCYYDKCSGLHYTITIRDRDDATMEGIAARLGVDAIELRMINQYATRFTTLLPLCGHLLHVPRRRDMNLTP